MQSSSTVPGSTSRSAGSSSEVTDGGYVVLIEGQSYLIRSPDNYAVGDTVRVLFEQNNPNNRSILGKVA